MSLHRERENEFGTQGCPCRKRAQAREAGVASIKSRRKKEETALVDGL